MVLVVEGMHDCPEQNKKTVRTAILLFTFPRYTNLVIPSVRGVLWSVSLDSSSTSLGVIAWEQPSTYVWIFSRSEPLYDVASVNSFVGVATMLWLWKCCTSYHESSRYFKENEGVWGGIGQITLKAVISQWPWGDGVIGYHEGQDGARGWGLGKKWSHSLIISRSTLLHICVYEWFIGVRGWAVGHVHWIDDSDINR